MACRYYEIIGLKKLISIFALEHSPLDAFNKIFSDRKA